MKRVLYLLTVALFVMFAQSAMAQKAEDAIKYRQGVFRVIGWNFGSMAAMAKGKKPYDAEVFARNAEIVAFMSRLPLEGFTPGSETGDTRAKPDIWLDMEDFKAKLEKMQQEVDALAKVAKSGNFEASKSQLGEAGQACKACHDKYREKN
ncbi:MAG: cytochrome c [Burkholderiales bacterium]|jgi:cytochrome c556